MKYLSLIVFVSLVLTSCSSKIKEKELVIKNSPYNVETTYGKLKAVINKNPNLRILLELDHTNNAATVGLKLNPTKIIMFGNPKLGTPLMQASQKVSIDLPQKIVVYSDNTINSKVVYNNPLYLKEKHGIVDKDEVLKTISNALNNITDKAIN